MKVLVVEDHEAARLGISQILADGGFLVAKTVGSGRELLDAVDPELCDVVLMDVRLPDMDGLTALESLRTQHASLPVVILSAYDNLTYIARAAALGASDYVVKGRANHEVQSSLHRALRKERPLPDSVMAKVHRMMCEDVDAKELPNGFPLTNREAQVLRHVALGLSNKEIGKSLGISVETVKEHVQNILRKVKAADRTDAAVRAIQAGIVNP